MNSNFEKTVNRERHNYGLERNYLNFLNFRDAMKFSNKREARSIQNFKEKKFSQG